jgi:hypothetical protein
MRAARCVRSGAPILADPDRLHSCMHPVGASDCKVFEIDQFHPVPRQCRCLLRVGTSTRHVHFVHLLLDFSSFHLCNFLGLACRFLSLDVSDLTRRDAVCR